MCLNFLKSESAFVVTDHSRSLASETETKPDQPRTDESADDLFTISQFDPPVINCGYGLNAEAGNVPFNRRLKRRCLSIFLYSGDIPMKGLFYLRIFF
jgi:hypothetical protein